MGPPSFPPLNVQNSQNYNQNRYNQNQGNYETPNNQGFNKQRGHNFNQGNNNYQALNYQAPNNQAQVGPSNELLNYMKSNEATLRAMQTQMMEREPEATKDKVKTTNLESTAHVQPPVVQIPISEPDVAPKLHFDLSFADALLHMPKSASTFKSLYSNKERLFELANTPLNENCSALDECLSLADLGASINLMPLSVWKKLSLPELTPTRTTLELANRSVAYSIGVAKDVIVKVGKFHFLADFVVVDYDVNPRVPLILGRPFLRTARALVDVYREELILRDDNEKIIFHADSTTKYPHKHRIESINMINFIDISCEDNFEEVLKIKKLSRHLSGSTTSTPDSSPSLTPIETSDYSLEEFANELTFIETFPPGNDDPLFDAKSDLRELENLLNYDPSTDSSQKNHIEE
ncbi:reverse transcriptase domain-containing protein [Tanacetum coccineum]